MNNLKIETIVVGPLETNCYLLSHPASRKAIIVDPGFEGKRIADELKSNNLILDKILITHGHYDHIGGVNTLREITGAQVYINEKDAICLIDPRYNFSELVDDNYTCDPAEGKLVEGNVIETGKIVLTVLSTPGHSRGSVSFSGDGFIIVGDTLFSGSIGRTDLPGGSQEVLLESIQNKILSLPDSTIVYPGHGPSTTVGQERQENPFIA
ncbi:MAG: MBL fold metallo-hydrolase [bacterium]